MYEEVGESDKFGELAELLDHDVEEMADALVARFEEEIPDWSTGRPELREPIRRLTRDSIHAEVASLRDGHLPEELPPADAEFARESARIGAPVGNLSWGFRTGHALQWQHWMDLVERHERDPVRRRELLERGSAFFFAYADRMIRMVSDEYARERELLLRSSEQRRFHLVRELLDGAQLDSSSLGYDLSAWHVGMVVWGAHAGDTAHRLAHVHGRRFLAVGVVEDTYWGWLGLGHQPQDNEVASLLGGQGDGARVAVGGPHQGPAGFRRSHFEARDAHRAALGEGEALTRYEDVALIVLVARDDEAARAFVAHELRGLDGDDTRARRLRETLAAYLAYRFNAAATAQALGVHQQTVANRIRAIEERTGHSVASRHAELSTALRVRTLLRSGDAAR